MSYGINIDTLSELMTHPVGALCGGGTKTLLIERPEFRLERLELPLGTSATLSTDTFEMTLWAEEGIAVVDSVPLPTQHCIALPPKASFQVEARERTVLYLFSGPASDGPFREPSPSSDFRDKYWGTIESIVGKGYAGKRMLVKKGKYASLEYHCNKSEAYYIHSGKLLLRLRAGRAEDRNFELPVGTVSYTPPGLMHQRGGIGDTVIIEISTKDEDSDSYLVEDGQKTPMPGLPA